MNNQPQTEYLKLPGGTIAYDDTKTGEQVIFCMPLMGDSRKIYRFARPLFTEAGYRVITVDTRGLGESSIDWPDYSISSMGKDVIALIEHLGLKNVVVIGESITGGVAVWAAAERPDLFRGVVAASPFMRVVPEPNAIMKAVAAVVLKSSQLWMPYYKSLYPTNKPADFKAYTTNLSKELRAPGRYAVTKKLTQASHKETEAQYPKFKTPAIVVMGTKDPDFKNPEGEADICVQLIHAQKAMIQGGGHVLMAEFPQEFVSIVMHFINGIEG